MELSLVSILNKHTGRTSYFAVNDKHYDAMLAGSTHKLEQEFEWDWLGDVTIDEEILNEQGYYYYEQSEHG